MHSRFSSILDGLIAVGLLRHATQLAAHSRSRAVTNSPVARGDPEPVSLERLHVLLPVFDEPSSLIDDAIQHFLRVGVDPARIWVFTSERQRQTASQSGSVPTVDTVGGLSAHYGTKKVHCNDPLGVKADQVNAGILELRRTIPYQEWRDTLVSVYDIDSRPASSAVQSMVRTSIAFPMVDVFQLSSRFRLAMPAPKAFTRFVTDAGALRANRYVLSSELPKLLNRHPGTSPLRRIISRFSYAHITGHGVGFRLEMLIREPLPSRCPMEDVVYGLRLAAMDVHVVSVPGTDVASVPPTLREQFKQQARWFGGPLSGLKAIRDERTKSGRHLGVFAATMFALLEWLSAAFTIPLLVCAIASRRPKRRRAIQLLCGICFAELISAEQALGAPSPVTARIARLAAYPAANTLFGAAGWWSLLRYLSDGRYRRLNQ